MRDCSTLSVISWAASQISESQHLGAQRIEGFVHNCSLNRIQLGCLICVMQEKPLSSTGEIIQAAFETKELPYSLRLYASHCMIISGQHVHII